MPNIYANVEGGMVKEIVTIEDNTPPLYARYHPAALDHFIELHGNQQFIVRPGFHYDGSDFYIPPPPVSAPQQKRYVKVSVVRERMESAELWDDFVNVLKDDMPKLVRILTLESGIDPDNKEIRDLIAAAGANPDEILRE